MFSVYFFYTLFPRLFFVIALFSMMTSAAVLVIPLFMLQVYNRIIPTNNFDTLFSLLFITTIVLVFSSIVDVARRLAFRSAGEDIEIRMAPSLLHRAVASGDDGGAGRMAFNDLSIVRRFISQGNIATYFDAPFSVLLLVVLLIYSLPLGLVVVSYLILMTGTAVALRLLNIKDSANSGMAERLENLLGVGKAIKVFHAEGDMLDRALVDVQTENGWDDNGRTASQIIGGITRFLRSFLMVGVIGVGTYLVLQNQLNIGVIFAASILTSRMVQPFDALLIQTRIFSASNQAAKRLLKFEQIDTAKQQSRLISRPRDSLDTNNMSNRSGLVVDKIAYARRMVGGLSAPILRAASVEASQGEMIGVIGDSGSGKSIFLSILAGCIRPTGGHVLFNHRLIDDAASGVIGYLSQDSELVPGTVHENLMGRANNADHESMESLAQSLCVDKLVSRLPGGFDCVALEFSKPSMLSPSQRRLICLMRAFCGMPKLIVLDEPTISLQPAQVDGMINVIDQYRKAGSIFVVATSDLRILSRCDRIVELKDGLLLPGAKINKLQVGEPATEKSNDNIKSAGRLGRKPNMHVYR